MYTVESPPAGGAQDDNGGEGLTKRLQHEVEQGREALAARQREHVLAAQALGASGSRILFRHIMPLVMTPVIVEATFGAASVIIAEASLSFLGLGVQPPAASWGSMIRDGTRYLLVAPHLVLVPGLALFIVVLAVNLAGDRLRDRLDVRMREARR